MKSSAFILKQLKNSERKEFLAFVEEMALADKAGALSKLVECYLNEFDSKNDRVLLILLSACILCDPTKVDFYVKKSQLARRLLKNRGDGIEVELRAFAEELLNILRVASEPVKFLAPLLKHIGFSIAASDTELEMLFEYFMKPLYLSSETKYCFAYIFYLEVKIYENYVKHFEHSDQFGKFAEIIEQKSLELAKQYMIEKKATYNRENAGNQLATSKIGKPRFGIFLHQESLLAHVETMLGFLEYGGAKGYEVTVFSLEREDKLLKSRLLKAGANLVRCPQHLKNSGLEIKLDWLIGVARGENLDLFTVISNPEFMPFLFACGVARKQLWWSMKYYNHYSPSIDGYISNIPVVRINNKVDDRWVGGFPATASLERNIPLSLIESEREKYGKDKLILGVLARTEMFAKEEYLSIVVSLLEKFDHAVFLWTGRSCNESVQQYFEESGFAHRCFYIGWVDTKLFASIIDIFIDPFDFGSGLTMAETLLAGGCAVFKKGDVQYSVSAMLEDYFISLDVISKEDMEVFRLQNASEPDDYIEIVSRFVSDPEFFAKMQSINKKIARGIWCDNEGSAERYNKYFNSFLVGA